MVAECLLTALFIFIHEFLLPIFGAMNQALLLLLYGLALLERGAVLAGA